jgi:hypothetical protein
VFLQCLGAFTSDVLHWCLCNCAIFSLICYCCTNISLHTQRLLWKPNIKNALCWAFYCVNDNKKNDLTTPQTMHCIFYYNSPILNLSSKTQARQGLIIYNTTNGITTLKKHVNSDHCNIFFKFEKKVNCPSRIEDLKQLSNKGPNIFSNSISNFVLEKNLSRKIDVQQKQFLKDLGLLIIKNHLPLQFVESIWLKRFSMQLCPIIVLSKNQFSYELLSKLLEKKTIVCSSNFNRMSFYNYKL